MPCNIICLCLRDRISVALMTFATISSESGCAIGKLTARRSHVRIAVLQSGIKIGRPVVFSSKMPGSTQRTGFDGLVCHT